MQHLICLRPALLLLMALLMNNISQAQSASYRADLDALYGHLHTTYSWKDQVKGKPLQRRYDSLFQVLQADTASTSQTQDQSMQTGKTSVRNLFSDYYKLVQLLFLLRDNHLSFHQFPPLALTKADLADTAKVAAYRRHVYFTSYPVVALNIDSLTTALGTKNQDSVEGIYHYDSFLTVGIYRSGVANGILDQWPVYTGVVLQSNLPHWNAGQEIMRLYEFSPHSYRAVYAHPLYKHLVYYPIEKYRNGTLLNSYFYSSLSEAVYMKWPEATDHVNLPRTTPAFSLQALTPVIQYIRLGNFSAYPQEMKRSQAFYDRIRDSLTASTLVVDLRNNTGGAEKVSRKFIQLLRQYARKGRIHVLVNNATMSRGEIFTLELKALNRKAQDEPRVVVYGQTTKGTIAYGQNMDGMNHLPSKRYGVVLTDMDDKEHYLPYEDKGIVPDIVFNNDADWLQTLLRQVQ